MNRTYTILAADGEALQDAIALAGIFPAADDTVIALTMFDEPAPTNRLVAVVRDGDAHYCHVMPESKTVH
jgi:hypothetical protein